MDYKYLEEKIKTSEKFFDCFDFVKHFFEIEDIKSLELIEVEKEDFCIVLAGKDLEHAGIYYKNNIIHTSYNKDVFIKNINTFKNLYKTIKYYKIK